MAYGQLHQLIEQGKWSTILENLQENPGAFFEHARDAHRDDLPLHLACERRAPDEVIMEILKLHPEATKWKGRGDNFALHLATHRNLSPDVIEALIREYPEALDEVNAANFTPRNIGHSDIIAFQLLRRPTACWHQLMEDEAREEDQATRLKAVHERVDAAMEELGTSEGNFAVLSGRLDKVKSRLDDLEGVQREDDMASAIAHMKEALKEELTATDNRLTTIEDEIKAAAVKEFMAKAAARAHQSDILRMQKASAETAKRLRSQVEQVKSQLL